MTDNADPAYLCSARLLRDVEYFVCGIAECAPPEVGVLLARVERRPYVAGRARCSTRKVEWSARLTIDQEHLDGAAPEVEGEECGANGSTHQVRRR